jgi:hypothetical protein
VTMCLLRYGRVRRAARRRYKAMDGGRTGGLRAVLYGWLAGGQHGILHRRLRYRYRYRSIPGMVAAAVRYRLAGTGVVWQVTLVGGRYS